jgi:hypothetical protein
MMDANGILQQKISGKRMLTAKSAFAAGILIILCLMSPILFSKGKTGVYDWDSSMSRFEALRKTVVEFKQWPGNNPWISGGVPLASLPYTNLLSIEGASVILFGTFWGLRLGLTFYTFIGFIGAWKLSGLFWEKIFLRFIFSIYSVANAAVAYHMTVGHLGFQNFWLMPLLLYFTLRIRDDAWSGLKAGIVFGVAFDSLPSYVPQDALLVLAAIAILHLNKLKDNFRAVTNWLLLFISVVGSLIFYRYVIIMGTAADFPRITNWKIHYAISTLLKVFFYPYTDLHYLESSNVSFSIVIWELGCYLGIVATSLALAGLIKGLRWWHATILFLVWSMMGNDNAFYIMYWIQKLPTYSSQLCFTRIRMFIPLFLGISMMDGLQLISERTNRFRYSRPIVISLGILAASEVLITSHMIMKSSQVEFDYSKNLNPGGGFKNISHLPRPDGAPGTLSAFTYPAIRMNLGWLRGYGDPYLPAESSRIGFDEPGYISEFHQGDKKIEPFFWSPNELIFNNLKSSVPLTVNMNPGKAWYNNGKQLFPDYRIVETRKTFRAMPNKDGVVDLTYRYPGQRTGLIGTIVLLLVSLLAIVLVGKERRDPGPPGATVTE